MARNTKKKLAILAGTSKCLLYAEAKFCASEIPGEVKYYECLRTEYCCAFGCCVSPGFHFHHLWYYWLLVIIMFLVCSGGGWWYRYWLQGRYRAAASAIPSRPPNTRTPANLRGPTCPVQQARITYNSARNTVLLQRMWKGPQRNGTSSSTYNGNAATSTHYQNMSVVLNDSNCPYYQLYGPPPSYETVIAQTRGKIASPEHCASSRETGQPGNVLQSSPRGPQCFVYPCSPSTRYNVPLEQPVQCQNVPVGPRSVDNQPEEFVFPHFSQHCVANGGARQNFYCVPFEYQPGPVIPGTAVQSVEAFSRPIHASPKKYALYNAPSKSSDTSDAENAEQGNNVEGHPILALNPNFRDDRTTSSESSDAENLASCYDLNAERQAILSAGFPDVKSFNIIGDQVISKVHGRTEAKHVHGKHRDRERGLRHKLSEEQSSASSSRSTTLEGIQREDQSFESQTFKRSYDLGMDRKFLTVCSGVRHSSSKRQKRSKCERSVVQNCSSGSEEKLSEEGILEENFRQPFRTTSLVIDERKQIVTSESISSFVERSRSANGETAKESKEGKNRDRGSSSEGLAGFEIAFKNALRSSNSSETNTDPRQPSPSNNVILPFLRNAEKQKSRSPAKASDSCDLESTYKLDRSKSLD